MKLSLALLAVLAALGTHQVHSVPVPTRGLRQDLQDFLALVPVDEVIELFFEYLGQDEDFGEAIDYVLSDDFKKLLISVEAMPEVKSLLRYLHELGLDVYELVNKLNDLLGIDHVDPVRRYKITGGLAGFVKDVKALLPIKKIQELYEEKLRTSEEFAAVINKLKSHEFQGLVDRLMANPELEKIINIAEAKGIDVQSVFDFLHATLGLKFPSRPTLYLDLSRNLKDDLNDFLKLVPVNEIQELFFEYLSEDEDFGEALDYVLSDEFKHLIIDVENMSEVRELLDLLQESGLAAYDLINTINDLLGIDRISPHSNYKVKKITGGLPGFIEDIKALLPVDEIDALYKKKLETSKDFAALVKRLMSEEFQGLVDRIMANPRLQDLIKRAEAKGVDVQAILDFITSILGIKFRPRPTFSLTRNLQDDLNDFLNLVPAAAIQEIFFQYLSEDEEFGEALDYVLSDEFRNLVSEVENMSEIKGLLDFLEESGLEAYKTVNIVNDLLGIDRIHPLYNFKFRKITGGLKGFIEDVKAILPWQEIKEMYKLKLKTSEAFATLVERLQTEEFQELADRLMSNPTVQDLIKRAEAKGVDVQAILDFLTSLLGLKFPQRPVLFLTRNLKDDLDELLALVPVKALEDLFYEYLSNDEDFGEALDYVLSDEFTGLVVEVENLPEIKKLNEFLIDTGLDVYGFLNKLNDLLGIDHITPKLKTKKITGGLPGFIKDARALLPLDKIEALYKEKLQTSEDLKNLVNRLKSPEFQALVDKLLANPALQNLIKRAEAKGVNIQKIFDFLTTLLGLKFPARPQMLMTRNLKGDLDELLALVPVKALEDLFYEYLSNDEDFGEALDYVLSDEFTGLVTEVENLPEIKKLNEFLIDTGLDVYGFLNKLNDLLGIEHITPNLKTKKITGGLPGFIKDGRALLPLDKIEALYNEKLQTSEDLKNLVNRLKSPEFQALVDKLLTNPALQNLIKRAEGKGVDIQEIFDFLTTLLGLKFPGRPIVFKMYRNDEVAEILEKIWSMVPIDDIMDVVFEYMLEDQDFKKVMKYMLSDEFRDNLSEIEDLKEMRDVLAFLDETGVRVYEYINQLNEFLGLEKHLPKTRNQRISGGVTGLFKDIWAKLPREELWNLWNGKMASSKAFKEFVTRLETRELQYLIDHLYKHDGFLNMANRLGKLGVDWEEVKKIINTVIGIKFPTRPL